MLRFEQEFKAQNGREPTDAEWNDHYDNVAHPKVANVAEQAKLRADGVDIKAYNAEVDGLLDHVEHKRNENPPPDTITDPEADIGHHRSANKVRIEPEQGQVARTKVEGFSPTVAAVDKSGMIENAEKYQAAAKKRREAGGGTVTVHKTLAAEARARGMTVSEYGQEQKALHTAAGEQLDAALTKAEIVPSEIPPEVRSATLDAMVRSGFSDPMEALEYATAKLERDAHYYENLDAMLAAEHVIATEEGRDLHPEIPFDTGARPADVGPAARTAGRPGEVAATGEPPREAGESPANVWQRFVDRRIEARAASGIETSQNRETTRLGTPLHARRTQEWQPGNIVNVGIVKDLLVAEQRADGTFTLVGKPNPEGVSRSYNTKPHAGIVREKDVNFLDATRGLSTEAEPQLVDEYFQRKPTMEEFRAHMAQLRARQDAFRAEIEQQFNATGRFQMPVNYSDTKRWLLTKNIGEPGAPPLRITFFDGNEPSGHIEVRDFAEAAKEMIGVRKNPGEPAAEPGAEGKPQLVLPGAERITQAEQAQRGANAPLKPVVEQKPMDVGLFSDEAAQKELFQRRQLPMDKESRLERAREMGFDTSKVWYHGAARSDRLTEKGKIVQKRATSGPMPYFTDDPEIASSYTTKKADTSLEEPSDYAGWFKYKPEGMRSKVDIDRAWYFLDPETRKTIAERAYDIKQDDDGNISYQPGQGFPAGGKETWFDYYLPREGQGNPLKTLKEVWLSSGILFNDEEKFQEVLKLAGMKDVEFDHPYREVPGVLATYLKVRNPLDTSKTETLQALLPELEALASRSRRRATPGADMWAKEAHTVRKFVDRFKTDLADGTTYAWTSIPDEITNFLKSKGYDGILDTGGKQGGQLHNVMIPFEPRQVRSVNAAFDTKQAGSDKLLAQGALGKVVFREDRRPIITLAKTADASTFIHESGHVFLEELMRDAEHEKAPDILKGDAQTTLQWLGVDKAENIKTKHHEKFARGFEQYLREGVAPSVELAGVFARFRDWLLRIYQTLKGLGSEITPEIRGVFDRLLAESPQRTVIAPEVAIRPTLQDIHENDARLTEPHHAEAAADAVETERQREAAAFPPDIADEHSRGAAQTGTSPAELASLREPVAPAEPVGEGGAGGAQPGPQPQGGGDIVPEGPRLRVGEGEAGKLEVEAVGPHVPLDSMPDKLTDKVGNIRLENLNTPADVNEAIRALYRENKERLDSATRGRVGDQAVMDLADAMGVNPSIVANNMDRLRAMSLEDNVPLAARVWLMRDVFTKLAAEVSKAMQGDDVAAFAEARQRFLMAHETLSGITAEIGRGLRAFRSMGGEVKDANALAAMLKEQTGKTLFQLRQEMALGRAAETPAQVARMVNDAERSTYQKVRSGIISYVINNLISGPVTHATYMAGNTMLQLWRAVPVTGLASIRDTYGRATGRLAPGEGVYAGEMGARMYGMLAGLRDGWAPSYSALKTGVAVMKGDPAGVDMFSSDITYRPQQIPGRIGYVLETPGRAVTAIHTMHYGMNYEAEISSMAYRDAMGKGLEQGSDAFNASVAEFRQNPPESAIASAHQIALDQVLMHKPQYGTSQYYFQKAVNSNLAAKLVMPFVQVGTNILKGGLIESTPAAFLSKNARDNLLGRNGRAAQSMQYSQVVLGTGLAISTVSLAMEGYITGGGPSDPKQREVLEMTGWKPYSLKIGGEYIPYRKYLSVLGPLVAGAADMYEVGHAMSDKGLADAAAALSFGFAEVVMDETWMRGFASTIDAVRHWDRDGVKFLRNTSMELLPFSIGMKQIASLADPTWRSVRSEMDALRSHIPGLSQGLFPVRDLWGNEQQGGVMMAPSAAVNDPATQALQKAEYYPARIERKIAGVELSDAQYDKLTRIAGRDAHMKVTLDVSAPGFNLLPQDTRKKILKDAMEQSREMARGIIQMDPEFMAANIVLKRKALNAAVH